MMSSRLLSKSNFRKITGEPVKVSLTVQLILDIFGIHALNQGRTTSVQLAQLQYVLPRLACGVTLVGG